MSGILQSRLWGGVNPNTDPYWANVVLLMQADEGQGATVFVDRKGRHTVTRKGSVMTINGAGTPDEKYYYNASRNGGMDITDNATDFDFGTGDFCVEYWENTYGSGYFQLGMTNAPSYSGWAIWINGSAKPYLYYNSSTILTANSAQTSGAVKAHWALVRNGSGTNNLTFYKNGVADGSTTWTTNVNTGYSTFRIYNEESVGVYDGVGYIGPVRITKGVPRYTGDFTPPTRPFPTS